MSNQAQQTAKTLLQFLKQGQSKQQALQILLSLTPQLESDLNSQDFKQSKTVLLNDQILKQITRSIQSSHDQLLSSLTASQILINLSSHQNIVPRLISMKVISSSFNQLKEVIKPGKFNSYTSSPEKLGIDQLGNEQIKEFMIQKESYIVVKDSLDLISALFMLLTNLTREDSGKRQLMRFDSKKLEGANLVTLFTWYNYFNVQTQFLFCGNVIVNVLSLKEARTWMLQKLKNVESYLNNIFVRFLGQQCNRKDVQLQISAHRNLQTLKMVRNLMFEYQQHVKQFLKPHFKLVQSLMSILLQIHSSKVAQLKKNLIKKLQESQQIEEVNKAWLNLIQHSENRKQNSKPYEEDTSQLVIESLLLLTNTNAGRIVLKNQGFAVLINCIDNNHGLKIFFFDLPEYLIDKIDAIRFQLA